jgi:HK97 family phage prohead protease
MKRIVLTDESLDADSERVLMRGARLARFLKNPVMLYQHNNWGKNIGRWKDVRVEGDRITAEPDFDMEDEFAADIARKYEQGYIKAASIGFKVISRSDDPAVMLPGQWYSTFTEWELLEASIVNVPSNGNAVQVEGKSLTPTLSKGEGEDGLQVDYKRKMCKVGVCECESPTPALTEEETTAVSSMGIQTTAAEVKRKQFFQNKNEAEMTELKMYLGLPGTATEADVLEAVKALQKQAAEAIVLLGEKMGAVNEGNKANLQALAEKDLKATAGVIGDLVVVNKTADNGQQTADNGQKTVNGDELRLSDVLAEFVKGVKGGAGKADELPDFDKLSKENPKELGRIKREEPEKYVKMFEKHYGKKPTEVKA